MTQQQRLDTLIQLLLEEQPAYRGIIIPKSKEEKKRLLRTLMNLRPPKHATKELLAVQDAFLQEELAQKGIVPLSALAPIRGQIYLWQGDITTLEVDGIVNAANCQMLGCFHPCHGCIDNAIHTFAGIQLRLACAALMEKQGHDEPAGQAKITPAYNLPSKYVLHTVGPIVDGPLTQRHCEQLASCYRSCLKLAVQFGLRSLAFCCISTGEFRFPHRRAAEIAVRTVSDFIAESGNDIEVVFNVYKKEDYDIYRDLLQTDR